MRFLAHAPLGALLACSVAGCEGMPVEQAGAAASCASASQSFVNQSRERVEVLLQGPDTHRVELGPMESKPDSYPAGTYHVEFKFLTGELAGITLSDATIVAGCGQALAPYAIFDEMAVLELTNTTRRDLWITIDGETQNRLAPGEAAQYGVESTIAHRIKIVEDGASAPLRDDDASGVDEYFGANTLTPIYLTE